MKYFFIFLLCFNFTHAQTPIESLDKQLNINKSVKSNLDNTLSMLLPVDTYLTNVQGQFKRIRLEKSFNNYKNATIPKTAIAETKDTTLTNNDKVTNSIELKKEETLPGFRPIAEKKESKTENSTHIEIINKPSDQQIAQESKEYIWVDQLTRIDVQVFIDTSIEDTKYQQVKTVLSKNLKNQFPNGLHMSFSQIELYKKPPPKELTNAPLPPQPIEIKLEVPKTPEPIAPPKPKVVTKFIYPKLAPWENWQLWAKGLGFYFLASLMLIVLLLASNKKVVTTNGAQPTQNPFQPFLPSKNSDQLQPSTSLEDSGISHYTKDKETLLNELCKNPYFSKLYLSNLSQKDKILLHSNFNSSTLKEMLSHFTNLQNSSSEEAAVVSQIAPNNRSTMISQALNKIVNELLQFNTIAPISKNENFNHLTLVEPTSLIAYLRTKTVVEKFIILCGLGEEKFTAVLEEMHADELHEFMAFISDGTNFQQAVEENRNRVLEDISLHFKDMQQTLYTHFKNRTQVMELILSNSIDNKELFHILKEISPQEYEAYSKYDVNLDDLLKLDAKALTNLLGSIDNTTLASAMCGLDKTFHAKILGSMGKTRKVIIEDLISFMEHKIDRKSVAMAQRQLILKARV